MYPTDSDLGRCTAQELAHLLQEPLQAHVSTRFFAGQQGTEGEGGAQHVQLAAKLAASRKAGQVCHGLVSHA